MSLRKDVVEQDYRWRTLVPENPRVSFVSYSPRDKHGYRSHGFPVWDGRASPISPPLHDGAICEPSRSIHVGEPKLVDDQIPKPDSEVTFEEKMWPRF